MPFTIIDLLLIAAIPAAMLVAGALLALSLWRSPARIEPADQPQLRLVHSAAPESAAAEDRPATDKRQPAVAGG